MRLSIPIALLVCVATQLAVVVNGSAQDAPTQAATAEPAEAPPVPTPLESDAMTDKLAPLPAETAKSAAETQTPNSTSMRDQLSLQAMLGLGGSAKLANARADLDPSIGASLRYEHPAHRYFALGGQVALQSWITSPAGVAGSGRSTLVDVSLWPKARVALNESAELYLAIPLGLSFDFAANDSFGGKTNTGFGWNFAGLLGGQLAFNSWLGMLGEMGFGLRGISHEITGTGNKVSAELSMHQFIVTAGLFAKL